MARRARRAGKSRPRRIAESLADATASELILQALFWPVRIRGRLALRALDAIDVF